MNSDRLKVALASTLLAVLFVPIFYVNMQRFSEWLAARKKAPDKSRGEMLETRG